MAELSGAVDTAQLLEHMPLLQGSEAAGPSECVGNECMRSRLSGLWVALLGDSTHRMLHDALLALLHSRYGATIKTVHPHIDGSPVADLDNHQDYDSIVSIPGAAAPMIVSMRFLRGLDLQKLELNARDWRQRHHYLAWTTCSHTRPPHAVLGSDDYTEHPLLRQHLGGRTRPNVALLSSCAWDLPAINRSANWYAGAPARPNEPCPRVPRTMEVRTHRGNVRAPVLGAPCLRRGLNLSDAAIYHGFGERLRDALTLLRERADVPILRSCHQGTHGKPRLGGQQLASTLNMAG